MGGGAFADTLAFGGFAPGRPGGITAPTAARRETSAPEAATGAAICLNSSSFALSSSISIAKVFFIHAARSLREKNSPTE